MDHLDTSFHDHEMDIEDDNWDCWIAQAEKIARHNLDGENSEAARAAGTADGYSLDDAFNAYRAGMSPAAYVRSIKRVEAR